MRISRTAGLGVGDGLGKPVAVFWRGHATGPVTSGQFISFCLDDAAIHAGEEAEGGEVVLVARPAHGVEGIPLVQGGEGLFGESLARGTRDEGELDVLALAHGQVADHVLSIGAKEGHEEGEHVVGVFLGEEGAIDGSEQVEQLGIESGYEGHAEGRVVGEGRGWGLHRQPVGRRGPGPLAQVSPGYSHHALHRVLLPIVSL
jgi:hypothetical protein